MKLQAVRGMKDLLPEQYRAHQRIIDCAESVAMMYGYQPIATPILEYSSVFSRTLGDSSEVVNKEMYSFLDRSNDSLTLRPEFTAGIMRAFIANGLQHQLPLRWFSAGPVFRYDRPQAGRQRQFHQINFEYLGAKGPYTDAETLALATQVTDVLDIIDHVKLELNSLGCSASKHKYGQILTEYFQDFAKELSPESQVRLTKNPLRILDSKNEHDIEIASKAPLIGDYYTAEAQEYFEEVQSFLKLFKVDYILNPRLVRGLDYYCHTAFEFTTTKLGAQAAVLAGGRYDGLCKLMGGPEVPAIGFAGGIERIALLKTPPETYDGPIVFIPITEAELSFAIELAQEMRHKFYPVMVEHSGKLAKKMQNANNANAKYVVFIGNEEIQNGNYKLRNMQDGTEKLVTRRELLKLSYV